MIIDYKFAMTFFKVINESFMFLPIVNGLHHIFQTEDKTVTIKIQMHIMMFTQKLYIWSNLLSIVY